MAKINRDVKNELDLWRASEEYRIPYPKLEFYIKYLVIMNLRSWLMRIKGLRDEPGLQGDSAGDR